MECMPSKCFKSSAVVSEVTRPDFHTNHIWQPQAEASPVATISLLKTVSSLDRLSPNSVFCASQWGDMLRSIDGTEPVSNQKPRKRKHAKTAASYKQVVGSLCTALSSRPLFEMFLHTVFVRIAWCLQAGLSRILDITQNVQGSMYNRWDVRKRNKGQT